MKTEDDPHPLTTHLHEVFWLSPAQIVLLIIQGEFKKCTIKKIFVHVKCILLTCQLLIVLQAFSLEAIALTANSYFSSGTVFLVHPVQYYQPISRYLLLATVDMMTMVRGTR